MRKNSRDDCKYPKEFHYIIYLFVLDPASLKIIFATKILAGKGIFVEDERNTKSFKPSFAKRLWQPCDFQANTRKES